MAPLLLQRVCVTAIVITHLKSHAATSHSFHFKRSVALCCHGEESWGKKALPCSVVTAEGFFQ